MTGRLILLTLFAAAMLGFQNCGGARPVDGSVGISSNSSGGSGGPDPGGEPLPGPIAIETIFGTLELCDDGIAADVVAVSTHSQSEVIYYLMRSACVAQTEPIVIDPSEITWIKDNEQFTFAQKSFILMTSK